MIFRNIIAILPILVLVFLTGSGCVAKEQTPTQAQPISFIILNPDLESVISVVQVIERRTGDLKKAQIMIHNSSPRSITVLVRARYYDETGREVRTTFGQWSPLPISGRSSRSFNAVAPDATVTRIHFEIKKQASDSVSPTPKRHR